MKAHIKTLLATGAILACSLAQAQMSASFTALRTGPVTTAFGFNIGLPESSGTLAFSDDLIGALAVAGIQTTIIGPATGTVSDSAISITAPIFSLSGIITVDEASANPRITGTRATTLGGAMMVAPKANFATSGGSLSVTNISVDLATQGIYATISGAHGLATQTVRVWDYSHIEGELGLAPGFVSELSGHQTITGLKITDQAFDLFAQGLGLKPGGIAAMASIADYGVMTAAIPEPSTYLMMGLGLVGLSLVARRARTVS